MTVPGGHVCIAAVVGGQGLAFHLHFRTPLFCFEFFKCEARESIAVEESLSSDTGEEKEIAACPGLTPMIKESKYEAGHERVQVEDAEALFRGGKYQQEQ
jgi:hypothetical protein